MVDSSSKYSDSFLALFTPMGNEYNLEGRYPSAASTIQQIGVYQTEMADLRETLRPEIELIDSRIIAPAKELIDAMKKIRKFITKRDHKVSLARVCRYQAQAGPAHRLWPTQQLVHEASREAEQEPVGRKGGLPCSSRRQSLSEFDPQNLFKIEQDYEQASQDYEFHNNALKTDLPNFFQLATQFITPLFDSFYYMQRRSSRCRCVLRSDPSLVQCIYVMLEKFQSFSNGKFDMSVDVDSAYRAKIGDAAEQMDSLRITKRFVSTAHMMRNRQPSTGTSSLNRAGSQSSTSTGASAHTSPPPKPSMSSKPSFTRTLPPSTTAPVAAPPPYSAASGSAAPPGAKRAPPPPPMKKPVVAAAPTCPCPVYLSLWADVD
jgi:amphiphysin